MEIIKIAVIDTNLRAIGYECWFKEKSNKRIQVIGWGVNTQKAAALLKQKPDCVLYNPWGLFIADPVQALVSHQWGNYTGLCYGIEYLDTIYRLSPNTKTLICTEDIDRQFVLKKGKDFKNFSGYLHYSDQDVIGAIEYMVQGKIIVGDVPDHYCQFLKDAESFDAVCQQTNLLKLAAHQRRSPKQIYNLLLFNMKILGVRSFAQYKEWLSSNNLLKVN